MTNSVSELVNERIYCCRLQLEYYRQLLLDAKLPVQLIERFAGEALIFHLRSLYRCYLVELALSYQGPERDFENAQALSVTMQDLNVTAAEIKELVVLEEDSNSWLSRLLMAPLMSYQPIKRQVSSSGIPVLQVSSAQKVMNADFLATALDTLVAIIESQRSLSQEW